ncbi:phosphatase PAP2 family protein [Streptomyces qinzhouensis]|uniref:Phosphatase PAP2 family protein n=1 Tax=Streptomyces qinzhouensis TaxID=2599401 RepID=A0A5B8J115_9ACTN|nr:phosphatase PAP2 family protein [Streptomyces qinzhouensis]
MLSSSVRAALGPVAVLGALTVAVIGILIAGDNGPGRVDAWLQPDMGGVRPPWRKAALAVDFLAEPAGAALLVMAAVTVFLLLRLPRAAVFIVVGAGLTVGTTKLLKPLVGRTINGEHLSYPSGHTAFLTAFALMVALLAAGRLGLGRTAGLLLVLTAALAAGAAMGWAQVALSAHYPTDVLGGWCTALAVVPATAWLVDRTADAARPERDRRRVRPAGGRRA